MRNRIFATFAVAGVVSLTAWVAFAAKPSGAPGNPHPKGGGGNTSGIVTDDKGTTLEACITLSGVGNQDLYATVIASGVPTTTCTSPGGNEAPGQNPSTGTYSGTDVTPAEAIINGSVTVCATTDEPPKITGKEGGCPNNNWTATIDDVTFGGGTLVIRQGSETGPIVFQGTF